MGLLDGLLGGLMGGQQQQGDSNPLLQIAMQMITNKGGAGGGMGSGSGAGGLGDLIGMFQKAGMGDQVGSWVGTGPNTPINGDQLTQALGPDKIRDIASQLGMGHGDVAGGLAKMLPELINQVTPNGEVPQDHNMIGDLLGSLMKR